MPVSYLYYAGTLILTFYWKDFAYQIVPLFSDAFIKTGLKGITMLPIHCAGCVCSMFAAQGAPKSK
jgi:hypothetical protein